MTELLAKYDIYESSFEPCIKRASKIGISLESYYKIRKAAAKMTNNYKMSPDIAADLVINKYLSTLK